MVSGAPCGIRGSCVVKTGPVWYHAPYGTQNTTHLLLVAAQSQPNGGSTTCSSDHSEEGPARSVPLLRGIISSTVHHLSLPSLPPIDPLSDPLPDPLSLRCTCGATARRHADDDVDDFQGT